MGQSHSQRSERRERPTEVYTSLEEESSSQGDVTSAFIEQWGGIESENVVWSCSEAWLLAAAEST